MSTLSQALQAEHIGEDPEFDRLSTDTRSLQSGDLYVALTGERFDGNAFVAQAAEKGACGAIVSSIAKIEDRTDVPLIRVPDTTAALGQVARLNREESVARIIAITGSQGKTTVKEMTGSILGVSHQVLITSGNLNNAIGVPLTLLKLERRHDYAVIELGANAPKEIAYTVNLTMPDIALITNAAATHLEGFGSLEGVVGAKGEIIDGLPPAGTIVLNAEDSNLERWVERAGERKVVTFSTGNSAGNTGESPVRDRYCASAIRLDGNRGVSFRLHSPRGEIDIELRLAGRHNVANAVAAAAVSMEAGAALNDVKSGLELIRPVKGRLDSRRGAGGALLIDDSYNASPASFRAAIDVLGKCSGNRILIVGDMGELGADAEQAHKDLGSYARACGIDELWAVGGMAQLCAHSFGSGGRHFGGHEELIQYALGVLGSADVALVKGSRSAAMDRIAGRLEDREGS